MDKKRYEVTIAGVEMSIISDEREEFVMKLVNQLDREINDFMLTNKRSAKIDAALLLALDYSCEKIKAEKRVRNLEAQISLYDANLRRMREENIRLKKALLEGGSAGIDVNYEEEAAPMAQETEDISPSSGSAESSDREETAAEAAVTAENTADVAEKEEKTASEEKIEENADGSEKTEQPTITDKLSAIENLLRGRRDG